ncbi:MAG TPA: alpha/beta hydrolase, partial [Dehalococcoidia bacterium]
MQTQTVTVRDGRFRVHLRTAGSGEPLLFLHGETGLREPDEALDRLAGRFTVYAPDHPGWGASEGLEHLDDILDLA